MRSAERSIEVSAPAAQLFDYLAAIDNVEEWQSGVRSVRLTSDGPVGVGSTAVIERQLAGQHIKAPLRITAYDPSRRLALTSEASGVSLDAELEISGLDAGRSRLTYRIEINASGFMRFIEPMIASTAEADLEDSLRRIRDRFALARGDRDGAPT